MMRVVVIGDGRWFKNEAAIARAVRSLGHACRLINVRGWTWSLGRAAAPALAAMANAFRPDVVILGRHAYDLGEERLRRLVRNRFSTLWYQDLRIPPIPEVLALGRIVNTMFTTYAPQVETYQAAGIRRVRFLPQGVDPDLDRPADRFPEAYRCDVSFVGNASITFRHELFRRLAKLERVQFRGSGWNKAPAGLPVAGGQVYGKAYAQVVAGAAICLGIHSEAQETQYASASNRMWKVLGCGGFFLGPFVEGINQMAQDGVHCAYYRDPDECLAQVGRYLASPGERRAIAAAGRAHAMEHHTYAQRIRLMLEDRGYPLDRTFGVPVESQPPMTRT
ncbi:MAG TPA: glycosyltransferase [Gemmatimonadales bacterium]|nr:glycosyltransferase [Gemmatimonadales bacterium]